MSIFALYFSPYKGCGENTNIGAFLEWRLYFMIESSMIKVVLIYEKRRDGQSDRGALMGKKILIVDDAMFMRKMIRKILGEEGYTDVEEATDGEKALELFDPFDPDLVLLDITMPGMSGLEVLEKLLARRPQTKVVMCSAVGQESTVQQALTLGALDFIVKPFKPDEFKRTVAHYLR